MQAFKQYQVQLSFIALLVIIKFVIIPVFDWQDEQLIEIQLLQKKISRIDGVLENRGEIEQYRNQLEKLLADTDDVFLTSGNVATFQLEQQQWLEDKIKLHGLDVSNIGWSPQQTQAKFNVTAHNVQLNVDGKTIQIMSFLQDIQAQKNYIAIQAFSFNFKRQEKLNLGSASVRLNLVFYRGGGNS